MSATSPSRRLFALAVVFIGGIAAHALDERPWSPVRAIFLFAALLAAAALAARRRPHVRSGLIAAAIFLAAVARYESALPRLQASGTRVTEARQFRGFVVEEPAVGVKAIRYVVGDALPSGGGLGIGKMEVSAANGPEIRRGEMIAWRCAPRVIADGLPYSPDDHARVRGVSWRCFAREPIRLVRAESHRERSFIESLRGRLRTAAARALPEPESSLLLGILIGDRGGVPPDLTEAFRSSGTSHILAVSGYNVSKFAGMVVVLFACLLVPRRPAALGASLALFGFAALSGGSASVVRAAIMGSLAQWARLLGRKYDGRVALAAAGAAMLGHDPLLLAHDIGFCLSFAAVWGLQAFTGPFEVRFRIVPSFLSLRRTLAESTAATLATFPLILHVFGSLALAAPITNSLVLPFIPAAMATGTLALFFEFANHVLAVPAALATLVLLRAVEYAVEYAGRLPLQFSIPMGAAGLVASYAWIALLWYALVKAKPIALVKKPLPAGVIVENGYDS